MTELQQQAKQNKKKNACQIKFSDSEVDPSCKYKSLYLDTLGAEARRSPSPASRCQQHFSADSIAGYLHGTLSTAGIQGARPTTHSVTKHKQVLLEAAGKQPCDLAAIIISASCAPGRNVNDTLTSADVNQDAFDPGMRPKVLIKHSTNRPDLTHTTADIDGAQPYPKTICHHPRNTNPLSPEYKLATGSVNMPGDPDPPQKELLRNTMDVTDIPGAYSRVHTPATRAAAARAAKDGSASSVSSSARPGVLDVADIDGTSSGWRPYHRARAGVATRDTTLNVTDINSYLQRFKPGPRAWYEGKGHPQGPRGPPAIKPRSHPGIMDNSLRTLDIEGFSVQLAPKRAPHAIMDVADIEGAQHVSKDRSKLFEVKKAASTAVAAQQAAGQAVLSGLQISQRELLLLWNECSRLDRQRCGLLTGPEMEQAMQCAQLQLSAADLRCLMSALKNNAGLLNYRRLTQQLKGRTSRPVSAVTASAATAPPGVAGAGTTEQLQQTGEPEVKLCPPQRPMSAQPAALLKQQEQQQQHVVLQQEDFSSGTIGSTGRSNGSGNAGSSRPSTAPARPCSSGCSRRRSLNNQGVSPVSHWFAGSSKDLAAATAELSQWRPGQGMTPTIRRGHSGKTSSSQGVWQVSSNGCSGQQQVADAGIGLGDMSPLDVVPGWLVGADALHGTFKVVQPFGEQAPSLEATATAPAAATGAELGQQGCSDEDPVGKHRETPNAPAATLEWEEWAVQRAAAAARQRPASAAPCVNRPARAYCNSTPTAAGGKPAQLPPQQQQQPSPMWQRPASASVGCRPSQSGGLKAAGRDSNLLQNSSSIPNCSVVPSCSVGLAERRRLQECEQQDLQAVRLLA